LKDALLKRLSLLEQAQASRPMPHSELVRHEMELIERFVELGIVSPESFNKARNHDYNDFSGRFPPEPFDCLSLDELRGMLKYDETEAVPE